MPLKIRKLKQREDVYDITVEENHNFYANGILVHNCCEITLPTRPMQSIDDGATMRRIRVHKDDLDEFAEYREKYNNILYDNTELYEIADEDDYDPEYKYHYMLVADEHGSETALCTLSAINFGRFNSPEEMQKPCEIAVRALDELLDYQKYPLISAEVATKKRRPLGIGIINLAYWLAKNDSNYSQPKLKLVDRWAEAWSYYLIDASCRLAEEKGPCLAWKETKYSDGIVPCDTRRPEVDELIKHRERMPWKNLRERLKKYGIRNSTLTSLMPSESSAQVSNSTNGVEPPRAAVSVKQSKHGVLKQVVPGVHRLKNKYEYLWDQRSPKGYLKISAILTKWLCQAGSFNTSYNPKHYPGGKVSMTDLLTDLLTYYRYGGKTLYYFNTFVDAGEIEIKDEEKDRPPEENVVVQQEDEICESCAI